MKPTYVQVFPAWMPDPVSPFRKLGDDIVIIHSVSPLGVVAIVADGYDASHIENIELFDVETVYEQSHPHGYCRA